MLVTDGDKVSWGVGMTASTQWQVGGGAPVMMVTDGDRVKGLA